MGVQFPDRRGSVRAVAGTLLLLLLAGPARAQPFEPWPGASYDPAVPTLEAVVGHDFGADITRPADLVLYLEALAAAAPERTRLVEYARSWEDRPLHYLLIGSAASLSQLETIRAGMQRLADPRGAARGELERLVDELPVVVWLAHGVHGDEISSSDAALLTAYHLLADRGGQAEQWLQRVVVVIDPAQNPDGRARFFGDYQRLRGPAPRPSPIAAERAQDWPGARTNHYLFDMNRDWFALTQPEVRGRVRAFLSYYPMVYVDLHEMGTDASYYFPPPTVPYNPYLADSQRAMLERLGQGAAQVFDRFGFRYYTREIFDAYYPGYGDTWPALHGAAGMTFETASARGLLGQRSDGTLVSYRDGVHRHFAASLATVGTAAEQRRRLLEEFVALRSAAPEAITYVLSADPDPGRAGKLAGLLMTQGVEVRRVNGDTRLCGGRVTAGSYVVSTDQPAGRLAGTLLAAESPAGDDFWAEQERLAAKRLPVEVYDVVAWSLPLLFGVPMTSCSDRVDPYPVMTAPPDVQASLPGEAAVAYLVPWGTTAAVRFLTGALQDGLHVEVATEPFTRGETNYPRGSLIVGRSANGDDLPRRVLALARASGAAVAAADSSWVDDGVNFGSDRVLAVPAPQVALAWDHPTSPYSAGAWRYVLERKLGYPVTPVRVRDLGSRWLDQFDALVLPDGDGYREALDDEAGANLERWVRRGGTLIGVGGALEYLASRELLTARPELRATPDADDDGTDAPENGREPGSDEEREEEDAGKAAPVPGTLIADDEAYRTALRPKEEPPREIPGVLVKASVDADHWLSAGLPAELALMVTGSRIFTPLRLDKGTNVVSFLDADELVAGGHLWEQARRQLARKPAVLIEQRDRGQVIGYVVDPSFRGMMDGLDVLVANSLFFGPATARPVPSPPPEAGATSRSQSLRP